MLYFSGGEMHNKMDYIEQFVDNLMLKKKRRKKISFFLFIKLMFYLFKKCDNYVCLLNFIKFLFIFVLSIFIKCISTDFLRAIQTSAFVSV